MRSSQLAIFCLSAILLTGLQPASSQVVINEYSCSNLTQFPDNYGDYGDWIELYNSSASTINLGGYFLSDDSLNNQKWAFPASVSIAGQGFVRIWADGRDVVSGSNIHASFKLNQTKNNAEFIVLSNPSGTILDYIKLNVPTQLGHSRGRVFNGIPTWVVFTNPTPNASNNGSTYFVDYADKPNASHDAGLFSGPIVVSLVTNEPTANIYYTLDGTQPTASSSLYSTPIAIGATTVLKAITISSDPLVLPSFIEYETYFINVSHTIPVVSISGNSLTNLANGNGNLEPKGTFEYFDTSWSRTAKTYGEFNRHGQDSWVLSQRSLDFVSRDEMGYNHSLEDQFFPNSARQNFQRLILRAAGDDNYPADHRPANAGSAHLRDAYIHNLAINHGMDLDVRRGIKCVVYLNGQYWGVYDIRENPDDHDFTDYYYGQDKYNLYYIETWGTTWAEYGGNAALTSWDNLYNYILFNAMTDPAKYQYVMDRLDAASLTDYVLTNMFTVCSDWLNYNTGWWRGLDSTGSHLKWGYILWDNDATFGHYINYTQIPNTNPNAAPCDVLGLSGSSDPEGHITLLNKLRTNPDFNEYYITRQVDLWNTAFSCDEMIAQLDSTVAVIDPEMAAHANRWSGTYTEWTNNVQDLRNFILSRCNALSSGFANCFSLQGPYDVTFNADPINVGYINVNTLTVNNLPWSAKYYSGVNTTLTAVADSGNAFSNWTSNAQVFNPGSTSPTVTLNLTGADSIVAHFNVTTFLPEQPDKGIVPVLMVKPTITSGSTQLVFDLPQTNEVSLRLFSPLGQQIAILVPIGTLMPAGIHQIDLDLSASGLGSGMYYAELITGKHKQTRKIIYQKAY